MSDREPCQNVDSQKSHRYPKKGGRRPRKKNNSTSNVDGQDFGHHVGLQQA